MLRNASSTTIILVILSLIVGSTLGYFIQEQNINNCLKTIHEKNITLIQQEELIQNYEEKVQAYTESIESKQLEIDSLKEGLDLLKKESEIEPNIIQEKTDKIIELENEVKKNYFEIIRLQARLGERLNWHKYQKHDVTFEYPEWVDLSIIDNGYYEGRVISVNLIDPVNYFYYTWMNIKTVEEAVKETEDVQISIEFIEVDVISTKINGHDAVIYLYNLNVGDGIYHGVICAWECTVTNRVNILFQYTDNDPYTIFFQILSTIKCHSDGEVV